MEKKPKKANNIEKEMTLEDVIGAIKGVEVNLEKKIISAIKSVEINLEKKIDTSIDELAIMVQNNFLRVEGRMDKMEGELKLTRSELKSDIADVKVDLNKRVDIFKHKDLEFRVEKLEEKVGVGK